MLAVAAAREVGLLDSVIATFLRENDLVADLGAGRLTPLTGGVSSDIWKVETHDRVFVIKKALPQLRVAQVWTAPVSRNANEVRWLIEAARIVPAAVPQILAHDAQTGIFAMSYLDPAHHPVWKEELRRGHAQPSFASQVGATLAAVHAGTAGSDDLAQRFSTDATFHAIRIEPYLEATARVHADLADELLHLAGRTLSTKHALVHGDVSPKNILMGPNGPVFLDAECAWYGDPAFDLAFCLNHLLLKCVWTPSAAERFLACFDALAESYFAAADWEPRAGLETRAASLLPALLLARIDGKSPVEYISDDKTRHRVGRVARSLVSAVPSRLTEVSHAWKREILA
jgi:aminoglycoside phosphotransferase (APT) family kinase protein